MEGILYGVGVGPGDPELLTLKACRIMRESDVIAVPGDQVADAVSYRIALQAVPEIDRKETIAIPMPMTHDREKMLQFHRQGAGRLERYLDDGKNVSFLTLGDPVIYSTFSYLQRLIEADGYRTETISGIPSFCAAAARLKQPLVEWNESLTVVPVRHKKKLIPGEDGTYVLMKAGRRLEEIGQWFDEDAYELYTVENCGMPGERIVHGISPDDGDPGYFTLVIARKCGDISTEHNKISKKQK